jgi:hypothetical protein
MSLHPIAARVCTLRLPIKRICCRISPVCSELAGGLNTGDYCRQVRIQLRLGFDP